VLDAYGRAFDAGLLGGISRCNDIWSADCQAQGRLQAILSSIGTDAHHLGESVICVKFSIHSCACLAMAPWLLHVLCFRAIGLLVHGPTPVCSGVQIFVQSFSLSCGVWDITVLRDYVQGCMKLLQTP
jgi:hypothetical protein